MVAQASSAGVPRLRRSSLVRLIGEWSVVPLQGYLEIETKTTVNLRKSFHLRYIS